MEDLWFKIDEESEQAFKKMFVRYKKEIVHLGLEDNDFDNDINPLETTGAYLSPKEFKEALLDEDTVVLDTRNDYEYDLGHFRGAIRPDIRNFRELPQWVRDNKEKTSLKQVFKVLGKNDQLMWLSLGYWFYGLGINTLNALQLYYFTFILGDSGKYSILYGLNTVVGLVSVSLFPSLAGKFNRKRLFYGCIAVMLGGIGIFSIAGTSLPMILTAAELFFIPQPLVFLVILMIISDSVEYGQWKLGHRDESLTLSVRPLVDKLGGAMSNWLVSTIAVAAGMTTGASASTITTHQQSIFKLSMFGFPAAAMLIGAFIIARKITLTEARHAEIVEELVRYYLKGQGVDL